MTHKQKLSHKIWRHFQKTFVLYILIGVLASLAGSLNIYFFQKLLDDLTKRTSSLVLVIYALTLLLVPLLGYLSEFPRNRLLYGVYYFLKSQSLQKVSRLDYQAYLSSSSGTLLQKIEAGSTAGQSMTVNFWSRLFRELLPDMLFNLFFIALIDLRLIGFILLGYVLVFLVTKYLLVLLEKLKETTLLNEERLNRILTRGISELVTFRVNRKYQREIRDYQALSGQITRHLTKMTLIHELFFTIFALLVALIKVLVVVLFFTHQLNLTLGGIVALVAYIDKIYNPVAIFNVLFVQYRLDKLTFGRLQSFFDEPEDENLQLSAPPIEAIQDIQLEKINLQLGSKQILQNFDLQLRKGKIYGLVGQSGAGKSTILKVILGLFKANSGTVKISGRALSKMNLEDLYAHTFYISEEVPIFEGTLRENIILNENQQISDQQIILALKSCQLGQFFENLADGLDTKIAERGSSLSVGERQRLAFARLFFSSAELVILDEATSALDAATEAKLLQTILPLLQGRLTLMITHHPENLSLVDEVIRL